MVLVRKIPFDTGIGLIVTFEAPYFDELLMDKEDGRLSKDVECHALWDYYGKALQNYVMAKENIVEENELSRKFDRNYARTLFMTVARYHQVDPAKMVRYWPFIDKQRIALGGKDHLPEQFRFEFWGH